VLQDKYNVSQDDDPNIFGDIQDRVDEPIRSQFLETIIKS